MRGCRPRFARRIVDISAQPCAGATQRFSSSTTDRTAKLKENEFAIPLVNKVKGRGFDVQTAIIYDTEQTHDWCMARDVAPVIPLRETKGVKAGHAEPPHCAHGEWTFAGTDYKRKATKWRCPPGSAEQSRCGSRPTGCTRSSRATPSGTRTSTGTAAESRPDLDRSSMSGHYSPSGFVGSTVSGFMPI